MAKKCRKLQDSVILATRRAKHRINCYDFVKKIQLRGLKGPHRYLVIDRVITTNILIFTNHKKGLETYSKPLIHYALVIN